MERQTELPRGPTAQMLRVPAADAAPEFSSLLPLANGRREEADRLRSIEWVNRSKVCGYSAAQTSIVDRLQQNAPGKAFCLVTMHVSERRPG